MYKLTGFFFVFVAAVGVVLPLLPTTPFLLIAAYCFSKSSEKWHQWLLKNKIFGKFIKNWKKNSSIDLKSKILAIIMIIIFGGYSVIFMLKTIFLKSICLLFLGYGTWFILNAKTT